MRFTAVDADPARFPVGVAGSNLIRVSPCRGPPFPLSHHQPFHLCSFLPSAHYRPCDNHRYLLSKHEGGSPTELLVTAFAFAARVDRRCSPHSAACDNAELRSILQYPIGLLLRLHAERAQLVLRPRMWLFAFFCLIAEHTYIRTCGRFATESFAFKEALNPLTRALSIAWGYQT